MKSLRVAALVAIGVLLLVLAILDGRKRRMASASTESEEVSAHDDQMLRGPSGSLQEKKSGRGLNPRLELIEERHGFVLPESAKYVQSSGDVDSGEADRGLVTVFELNSADLDVFLEKLTIEEKLPPKKLKGSPVQNGWNVWPTTAKTFVPGNDEYSELDQTWVGDAEPKYMLSCKSPIGDLLHVEVWSLEFGSSLLKVYTDWN